MSSQTPMIRQYARIKKEYPDSILFFRLGDFYEMFFEDAKIASKVLGIALTSRNKLDKNPVPLCGVPYHSAEPYLAKLLSSGHKVAICEQVEDPKLAIGVVERKVVKVLTPGVILDSENLESNSNNYITSIYYDGTTYSVSFCDISTGEFKVSCFDDRNDLITELSRLEPREVLVQESLLNGDGYFNSFLNSSLRPLITKQDLWVWDYERSKEVLLEHLGVSTLEPFGLDNNLGSTIACGVLLSYLKETQMDYMPLLDEPKYYELNNYVAIDDSTRKNLELIKSLTGDDKGPSLLSVLDKTVTAMGGRLIKQWLNYPLKDINEINRRLEGVSELKESSSFRRSLRDELRKINDIERLIGRITTQSAKPRDLGVLRDSSYSVTNIKSILAKAQSEIVVFIRESLDELLDVRERLSDALVDEPPFSAKDGGIIRSGFNEDLDQLKTIRNDGKKWISELELKEKRKTGISSLKIGYNRVFGYYIEVTKTNLGSVPDSYIRKQTLTSAERFITPELKEFEEKITTAQERILEIEKGLFESLRLEISKESERVRSTASLISELDVLCSLSEIADEYEYVRPEISDNGVIELKDSRHPVVERFELETGFVPNDINLDLEQNQFLLITGPNMAGKSTLIRQTALITLMTQMGSFVPASYAKIGIVDKIFTRVGASDNLAKGLSTFMVEMVETAYILRNSTSKSLVILDEIGRGTSTFDGMSIAWAVADYLHDLGARTLFATHYHELAQLALSKIRVKNFNVLVKEEKHKIIFLRKLVPGSSSHSYGIQVARLAGVPKKVINTSKKILSSLEKLRSKLSESMSGEQTLLFDTFDDIEELNDDNEILEEIKGLDPMNITPIEALAKLIELKEKIDKS